MWCREIKRCRQGGLKSTPVKKILSIEGAVWCQRIQVKYVRNTRQALEETSTVFSWGSWNRYIRSVRRGAFWVPESATQRYGHVPVQTKEHVADGSNCVMITVHRADVWQVDHKELTCRRWMEWCDISSFVTKSSRHTWTSCQADV